jgi:hypothetical protein
VPAFAAKYHQGDRTAAVEALLRNGPNVRYVPNHAYADAKLIIAWWVAALARRLPSGMAAYAVSPGAATDTKVVRNAGPALKYLFIPIVNLIPGMNQTPETAARRYLQASEFGTDVSGQFFASAKGKFTGPIEAQRHPHLHDHASQEAAWQAVVQVSGSDLLSKHDDPSSELLAVVDEGLRSLDDKGAPVVSRDEPEQKVRRWAGTSR